MYVGGTHVMLDGVQVLQDHVRSQVLRWLVRKCALPRLHLHHWKLVSCMFAPERLYPLIGIELFPLTSAA